MSQAWLYISHTSQSAASSQISSKSAVPEILFTSGVYQPGLFAMSPITTLPLSSTPQPSSLKSTYRRPSISTRTKITPFDSTISISTQNSGPSPSVFSSAPTGTTATPLSPLSSPSTPPPTHANTFDPHTPTSPPQSLSPSQKTNLYLLRSCALIASAQPVRALQAADIALQHASIGELGPLMLKARWYRCLALARLGRYQEAELEREAVLSEEADANENGDGERNKTEEWKRDVDVRVPSSRSVRGEKVKDDDDFGEIQEPDGSEGTLVDGGNRPRTITERDVLWGVWPGDEMI